MFAAIASLTVLGAILGLGLGVAARKFAVEGDPLADEIAALMPGSNCGQCGMAGCAVAAKAIAEGNATATVCPPGGKALATAIKPIYTAPSAEAAQAELEHFAQGPWGEKFPTVVAAWRRAWDRVIPFFAFPPPIRKVIYTTNAIESVNARLRKIIKTRGHFPSDDAASKLIWLALRNITAEWGRAAHDWKAAMNQFAILYDDRFSQRIA